MRAEEDEDLLAHLHDVLVPRVLLDGLGQRQGECEEFSTERRRPRRPGRGHAVSTVTPVAEVDTAIAREAFSTVSAVEVD